MNDSLRPKDPEREALRAGEERIARAFRRSLVVFVVLGLAVFLVHRTRRGPTRTDPPTRDVAPLISEPERSDAAPSIPFTDVTDLWGIDFRHENGARGEKLLPETMGSGVAVFDPDGDGDLDLFLANGCSWPWDAAPDPPPTQGFFLNEAPGRFRSAAEEWGLAVTYYGTGVAVGDVDGDGDEDLFAAALGRDRLFSNRGGRFVEVGRAAGVAGGEDAWSTSAGFFDADEDGDLDLVVLHYVRWSRQADRDLAFTLNGRDRAYGPPTQYEGTQVSFFENVGEARFLDRSREAGFLVINEATGRPIAKSLGLTFLDADDDGRLDVFVANDTTRNFLFHNLGGGRFEEIGENAGVAFDSGGRATGAMGTDAAVLRDDDRWALAIGNFANETSSLYVSRSGLFFSDDAAAEGLGAASRLVLSFGLFFFDADLDGHLDLFQANGHLEETIAQVQPSQRYRQPGQLFWNRGPDARSCFEPLPASKVKDLARPLIGRAAAFGDLDGDGDLDLVVTQPGDRPAVLRNDQDLGRHYLRLRLRGRTSNPDAVGALVEVVRGDRVVRRRVCPTRSYLSSCEPEVTIGLGSEGRFDGLRIVWPSGETQEFAPSEVPIDHEVEIREPR